MSRLQVAFIGWGAINSRVGQMLEERGANVEIVGIATRHGLPDAILHRARLLQNPRDLAAVGATLVVEAAGRSAVEMWAPCALRHARAMIVASTSAFCDANLLAHLRRIAETHGSRIIIPSGAIGGLDALGAAAVLALDEVVHEIVKPPAAWKGTAAEKQIDLSGLAERRIFFRGTARQAAELYPQNANSTVVTSLAGIGLDRTRVVLIADPAATLNEHRIRVRGAFGNMEIALQNEPLKTNPKSSELTALSLVRLIEQQISSLVI